MKHDWLFRSSWMYTQYIFGTSRRKVKKGCRGRDLNPHSPYGEQAFKARVSADSTTAATAARDLFTVAVTVTADKFSFFAGESLEMFVQCAAVEGGAAE